MNLTITLSPDVNLRELLAFARALGCGVTLTLPPQVTLAQQAAFARRLGCKIKCRNWHFILEDLGHETD